MMSDYDRHVWREDLSAQQDYIGYDNVRLHRFGTTQV